MELPRKVMTLVIPRLPAQAGQKDRVLLGLKKVRLGAGRWNGFGGKVEEGESVEDAARREAREEVGLKVGALRRAGVCEFHSPVRLFVVEMHIFEAREFAGTPAESDEMLTPTWFDVDKLPQADMWQSDLFWWPHFLDGTPFRGRFVFDAEDRVVHHDITLLN